MTMRKQRLAPGVAEKAVELLVHQADWVEHVHQETDFMYVSRVWNPETLELGAATIYMDALEPRNQVLAIAEQFSMFWSAVDAILGDPILYNAIPEQELS